MPQNRPVQGFDVSLSVMGPNGPELAGEWQDCDINISSETEEYLQTNSKMPVLLDGEIKLDGTLKRGWIDMNIVATTIGTANLQPGLAVPSSPRFHIACTVNAPDKGLTGRIRLVGVKFEKLALGVKAGKTVVDGSLTWKAEGLLEG